MRELLFSAIALLLLLISPLAAAEASDIVPQGEYIPIPSIYNKGGNYLKTQVEAVPAVVGDSVVITSSRGDIIATPHTLTASGWVKVDFTSRSFTGPVEISFGFNGVDQVQMVRGETWESYPHEKVRYVDGIVENTFDPEKIISETPGGGTPTIGDEKINPSKATVVHESNAIRKTDVVAYSAESNDTYVYKTHGQVPEKYYETYADWKEAATQPRVETKSVAGASKWNTLQHGQSISKDVWYSTRFWVEIPFGGTEGISGKYNIAIRPLGTDLSTALILDPWYSASWQYRKQMLCYGSSAGAQTNYQKKITLYNSTGTDVPENLAQYTTGALSHDLNIFGPDWRGQTFKAEATATVSKVWVYLMRNGTSPSSYALAIRNCTTDNPATAVPMGSNLCSGNITAIYVSNTSSSWYEFDMGAGTTLTINKMYAYMLYSTGSNNTNKLQDYYVAGGLYANGDYVYSSDGGATWAIAANNDRAFQVLTTPKMYLGGNCQGDFDDVRFTDSTGANLLDYWLDNSTYSAGAASSIDAYVELDTIPQMTGTNQNNTFYCYYGNSGATTTSNGTNTFITFDDFERGSDGDSIGGAWTETPHVHISTSYATSGNRSMQLVGAATNSGVTVPYTRSDSREISYRIKKSDNAVYEGYVYGTGAQGAWVYGAGYSTDPTRDLIYIYPDLYAGVGFSMLNSWQLLKVNGFDSANTHIYLSYGTQNYTHAATWYAAPTTMNYIWLHSSTIASTFSGVGNDTWIDDFKVANFARSQPLWGTPVAAEGPESMAVNTTAASSIQVSSALLGGNCTASPTTANITKWGVQYGTATTVYTAWDNLTGNQATPYTWTQTTSGLSPNTTYFYRAFVSDVAAGIWYGTEKNFTTLSGPTVVTLAATSITSTSAIIGGNITIINAGTYINMTGFQYGTTGAYGSWINTTVNIADGSEPYAFYNTTTGLNVGDLYYYVAFAMENTTYLGSGAQGAFVTVPLSSTNAVGTWTSTTAVNVTFTSTVGTGATAYTYCRWKVGSYPANVADGTLGFNTSSTYSAVTGLTYGTQVYMRIWTYAAEGGYMSDPSASTNVLLTTTGSISSITATTASVVSSNITSGTLSSRGIQYGTATGVYGFAVNTTEAQSAPYTWSDALAGLTQGNAYYFRSHTSGSGNAYGLEASPFMTLPYPPTGLTAVVSTPSSVTLTYTHSAVGAGATAYAYCRYSESAYPATVTDGTEGFNTTASSVVISGLIPGHSYFFRIWAYATESGLRSGYSSTTADVFCTPSYATGLSGAALYENACNGAAGDGGGISVSAWNAQTFTTDSDAHTVSRVMLKMFRAGAPGTVTASIRRTQAGMPYGADLCYGTSEGSYMTTASPGGWYDFTMNEEVSLEANTTYAIVVRALPVTTPASNYANWSMPAGLAYPDGQAYYSTDNGYSWVDHAADHCFEVWGYPCIEMLSAKVYQTYISTGDWLVVCHYRNVYPPYYPGQDVKQYFTLQLMHDSDVIATTSCQSWGYRPGSVYLSAAMVTPLEWGHEYRIRITGTYTNPPYAEQVLAPADWIGPSMTSLDTYLLSIASLMETYYSSTFTTYLQDIGQVFNSNGGVLFSTGVSYLTTERPSLFSTTTTAVSPPSPITGTQELQRTVDWEDLLGPYVSAEFTSIGGFLGGIDGQMVGTMFVVMIYILVATFAFATGHSGAAIFLAYPIFIGGALLDLVPMGAMFVALAIASFLLVYQIWLGRG